MKSIGVTWLAVASLAVIGCGKSSDMSGEATVPEGTTITLALDEPLGTDTHESGYNFTARTTEPIIVNGRTVIPSGAMIRGEVKEAKSAGDNGGVPEMTLAFEEVVDVSGENTDLPVEPVELIGDVHYKSASPGDKIVVADDEAARANPDDTLDGKIPVASSQVELDLEAGQLFAIQLQDEMDVKTQPSGDQRKNY